MSKIKGIVEWFEACPLIENAGSIDVNQLPAELQALGIYKQPTRTVTELIDGGSIVTETYYLLFQQPAQLIDERIDTDEYLEQVENWVEAQEMAEAYPQIGYEVYEISVADTFYMMSRDETEAVYQLAISIKYERTRTND